MDEELNTEAKSLLKEEQIKLAKVIESFERLNESKEWEILKELVFDKSLASIKKQLLNATLAPEINTNKLYRLQGEWAWAKKFNDINGYVDSLKKELLEINKRLK